MSWIWDLFQHYQIADNHRRSSDAQIDAHQARRKIADLEEKVDTLGLLSQALFEELHTVSGISESRLRERMAEIDLRDGKQDGKYDPGTIDTCPDCGHHVKRNRPSCFWCGAKLPRRIGDAS